MEKAHIQLSSYVEQWTANCCEATRHPITVISAWKAALNFVLYNCTVKSPDQNILVCRNGDLRPERMQPELPDKKREFLLRWLCYDPSLTEKQITQARSIFAEFVISNVLASIMRAEFYKVSLSSSEFDFAHNGNRGGDIILFRLNSFNLYESMMIVDVTTSKRYKRPGIHYDLAASVVVLPLGKINVEIDGVKVSFIDLLDILRQRVITGKYNYNDPLGFLDSKGEVIERLRSKLKWSCERFMNEFYGERGLIKKLVISALALGIEF